MEDFTLAIILSILAAIAWGINSHILKIGAQNENPMLALTYRAIVTVPILIPLVFILRGAEVLKIYFSGNFPFLILLLVMSILIGDGIFIYSLKNYPVSLILPIASSYPLVTIIILIATKSEIVTSLVLAGTFLIVVGIAIVTSNGSLNLQVPKSAVFLGIGTAIGWGSSVFFAKLILDQDGSEALSLMVVRTILIGGSFNPSNCAFRSSRSLQSLARLRS